MYESPGQGRSIAVSLFCLAFLAVLGLPGPGEAAPRKVKARLVLDNGYATAARSVAFSPDSKLVAVGGESTTLHVWTAGSGKEILKPSTVNYDDLLIAHETVRFSPDGKTLVVGSEEGIRCWDVARKKVLWSINEKCGSGFVLSHDGKLLAVPCAEEGVRVWDVAARKLRATLKPPKGDRIRAVAFAADGKFLVFGGDEGLVSAVHIADLGKPPFLTFRHATNDNRRWAAVNSLVVVKAGGVFASVGHNGKIKLWDAKTGKMLRRFEGSRCVFSPDGKRLYVWKEIENSITIWDVPSGRKVSEVDCGRGWLVHDMALSPDGKMLALAEDGGRIYVWDVKSLLDGAK